MTKAKKSTKVKSEVKKEYMKIPPKPHNKQKNTGLDESDYIFKYLREEIPFKLTPYSDSQYAPKHIKEYNKNVRQVQMRTIGAIVAVAIIIGLALLIVL